MKQLDSLLFLFILVCHLLLTISLSAQGFDPQILNTAADGTSSALPIGSLDPNWSVAYGNATGPTSDFIPATVVGNCAPDYWFTSPNPNTDWISYDFNNPDADACDHTPQGCLDMYFRREIILPQPGECGNPIKDRFCLGLDFYADNSLHSISVNGIEQYTSTLTEDPYNFWGFVTPISVNLCAAWQSGTNILDVQIKSCPFGQGFLTQVSDQFDNAYFADSKLDTSICSGQVFMGHEESGIYFDTLVSITDCDTILEMTLEVRPAPITSLEMTICQGDSIMIKDLVISKPGLYYDTLMNNEGCDSILSFIVSPADKLTLADDIFVCDGRPLSLRSPTLDTRWSTGEDTPSIRIEETGTYWATLKDMQGCLFTDTIHITYLPQIYIPNAFTPNLDGINDVFQPYTSEAVLDNYQLTIFDRWGSLQFSTHNPAIGWNGETRGKHCDNGLYFYMITYESAECGQIVLTGNVSLIR